MDHAATTFHGVESPIVSLHNTHAHSAWAVAVDASTEKATSSRALRARDGRNIG
jgi:hypothetical protein